ncbi:MAG: hypothetical protein ACQUYJ_19840 [Ferruginibacter sp.]
MDNNATPIELLFERAESYSKTSLELIKLHAINKSADVVSSLITRLVITIVVALFILSFTVGLSLWLGELLGKTYYGFFVTAGFYVLIGVLVYTFRNQWIKDPISNTIITQLQQQNSL